MCKNNIGLLSDGSIAYFAAGLGIVYNHGKQASLDLSQGVQMINNKKSQRYFDKHNDDITCIAFCRNRKIIATGENGQDPTVHIWDGLNVSSRFAC
jgi:WD40 repeat protein